MNRRHGSLFVVKYLKASSLAIQRAVAGSPLLSLRELEPDYNLPRLSSSGLPVIIGTRDRKAILAGSRKVIALYSSLFGIYRIIDSEVSPKLNTITDPFAGDSDYLEVACQAMTLLSQSLLSKFKVDQSLKIKSVEISSKSSPTNYVSWHGLAVDLIPLLTKPIKEHVKAYLLSLPENKQLWDELCHMLKDFKFEDRLYPQKKSVEKSASHSL
jgi:hypothetical protein